MVGCAAFMHAGTTRLTDDYTTKDRPIEDTLLLVTTEKMLPYPSILLLIALPSENLCPISSTQRSLERSFATINTRCKSKTSRTPLENVSVLIFNEQMQIALDILAAVLSKYMLWQKPQTQAPCCRWVETNKLRCRWYFRHLEVV